MKHRTGYLISVVKHGGCNIGLMDGLSSKVERATR